MSDDEALRGAQYRFEPDRLRYCISRGLLRVLLGHYLQQPPSALRFTYGPQGKPALAPPSGSRPMYFNVSHSDQLALFTFCTSESAIGVDVERIRELPDCLGIARRFFSAQEYRALVELRPEDQPQGFFNCWTRKEAYVKAIGKGLSQSLDSFEVSLAPGAPAQLHRIGAGQEDAAAWTLHALTPMEDYTGALAVRIKDPLIRCWSVPPLEHLGDGPSR